MWKYIRSEEELNAVLDESADRPTVLFKHSTRCPLSSMVKRRFEADFKLEGANIYLVDIISYRGISNQIASLTGVTHESPQLLILKDRETFFNASHGAIDGVQTVRLLTNG